MSLLAKKVRLLIPAALLFLFFACKKDQDIGLVVEPDDLTAGVFYTDTFTVEATTVVANDAILTSNSAYLLAGVYTDPFLGVVTSKAFTQLRLTEENTSLDPSAVVDSVKLFLSYDYSYGDKNQSVTVNIHKLTTQLADNNYYTFSETPSYDPQVFGTVTFKPADFSAVPISFPVSFGADLLSKRTNAELREFLPGFAVIPGQEKNGAILRYNLTGKDNCRIHVFYHTATATNLLYTVYPATDVERFYQITTDRSSVITASLVNAYDSLASEQTGGLTFMQAGTGLVTRIKIPSLDAFKDSLGEILINKAELEIPFSTQDEIAFPGLETCTLYAAGSDNRISVNSAGAYEGITTSNASNPDLDTYTLSMTSYIQALLEGKKPNNGIFISPGTEINVYRVNRVLLENNPATKRVIKLKLYYTVIK